jgi:hypothetical protein
MRAQPRLAIDPKLTAPLTAQQMSLCTQSVEGGLPPGSSVCCPRALEPFRFYAAGRLRNRKLYPFAILLGQLFRGTDERLTRSSSVAQKKTKLS